MNLYVVSHHGLVIVIKTLNTCIVVLVVVVAAIDLDPISNLNILYGSSNNCIRRPVLVAGCW